MRQIQNQQGTVGHRIIRKTSSQRDVKGSPRRRRVEQRDFRIQHFGEDPIDGGMHLRQVWHHDADACPGARLHHFASPFRRCAQLMFSVAAYAQRGIHIVTAR